MNASLAFAGRCLGGALIAGVLVAVGAAALATAPAAAASATPLSTSNNTPFPTSTLITGATWTSARYFPPSNQFGDILSTSSSTGDSLYVLIDDRFSPFWRESTSATVNSWSGTLLRPR